MIKTTDHLTTQSLIQLFNNECLALHIPNFYDLSSHTHLISKCNTIGFNTYEHEGNTVGHIGASSYQIDNDPKAFDHYYQNAPTLTQTINDLFHPHLSPIQQFSETLDNAWPSGTHSAKLHERAMFSGIIRLIQQGSMVHAHQDLLTWSNPNTPVTLRAQLAMNIYLQVPDVGGELNLWDLSYTQSDYQALAKGQFYILPNHIPPPAVSIQPKRGDLILFNSTKLHSISSSLDQDRIACSCFVGYCADDQPLMYWS